MWQGFTCTLDVQTHAYILWEKEMEINTTGTLIWPKGLFLRQKSYVTGIHRSICLLWVSYTFSRACHHFIVFGKPVLWWLQRMILKHHGKEVPDGWTRLAVDGAKSGTTWDSEKKSKRNYPTTTVDFSSALRNLGSEVYIFWKIALPPSSAFWVDLSKLKVSNLK